MYPTWLAWARNFLPKSAAVLLAAFSLLPAQTDSASLASGAPAQVGADSVKLADPSSDLLSQMQTVPDSVVASSISASHDSSVVDSSAADPSDIPETAASVPAAPAVSDFAASVPAASASKKFVLYLGGGENSHWFHLGVLYAVEMFGVPVDSVVGTSWGAYVGSLWARGVSPDDIQRVLLEKELSPFFGGASNQGASNQGTSTSGKLSDRSRSGSFAVPFSESGISSLRQRFSLFVDSSGTLHRRMKPLSADTSFIESSLSRLRLQESILRHADVYRVPFAVQGCKGVVGNSYEDIFASLPVEGNENSGQLCPYLALPAEDSQSEVSIISVPDPVRGEPAGPAWQRVIASSALENLGTQPGIIVRPHIVQNASANDWIQAGFSAMESAVSRIMAAGRPNAGRPNVGRPNAGASDLAAAEAPGSNASNSNASASASHASASNANASARVSAKPWFKFKPTFDSLSSETHVPIGSYWNASDTGIVAPRNFAYGVMQFPASDSVSFDMLADGDLLVDAAIRPTFDVAVGGFGSNAIGPNVFGELAFYYMNQMEVQLSLSGFWGENSYGLAPKLTIGRLWGRDWGLSIGYELRKLQVRQSEADESPSYLRIYSEQRNDVWTSLFYRFDARQLVSLKFVFANREYGLEERIYGDGYEIYPAMQTLHYEFVDGDGRQWFSRRGLAAHAELGLTSIGYDFGFDEVVPTFVNGYADVQYSLSPVSFVSLTAAIAGGFNKNRSNYPESFGVDPLDNCIRQRIRATPWSGEWFDGNFLSHHYALARLQTGLHYKGSGLWLSAAYVRDFEENPSATLEENRFVVEPAIRLAYKSFEAYFGMSRIVDSETFSDLGDFDDYKFFVKVGNYDLF